MNVVDVVESDELGTDVAAAARICAQRLRSEVLHGQQTFFGRLEREGLSTLKRLARAQGIVSIEFAKPMVSEGQLVALSAGGFAVQIARSQSTARARFTLAHEIAHTFFYDHSTVPASRLDKKQLTNLRAYGTINGFDVEERFCDEFASELLLPVTEHLQVLRHFRQIREPGAFLRSLERTASTRAVSVRMLLFALARHDLLPRRLVPVVLVQRPHLQTGRDNVLRVQTSFCADRQFFFPPNQRAVTIGFLGGIALNQWWHDFADRDPGRTYRLRSGVASLCRNGGHRQDYKVRVNVTDYPSVEEGLCLWTRRIGRWTREEVDVPVTYRYYAAGIAEAYCLAIVDVRGVGAAPVGCSVTVPVSKRRQAQRVSGTR